MIEFNTKQATDVKDLPEHSKKIVNAIALSNLARAQNQTVEDLANGEEPVNLLNGLDGLLPSSASLSEFKDGLMKFDLDLKIKFDFKVKGKVVYPDNTKARYHHKGEHLDVPRGIHSYRGNFEKLAIDYVTRDELKRDTTVQDVIDMLNYANGNTFEGYKGGSYTMSSSTDVWVAHHDEGFGKMIAGLSQEKNIVIIHTKEEE